MQSLRNRLSPSIGSVLLEFSLSLLIWAPLLIGLTLTQLYLSERQAIDKGAYAAISYAGYLSYPITPSQKDQLYQIIKRGSLDPNAPLLNPALQRANISINTIRLYSDTLGVSISVSAPFDPPLFANSALNRYRPTITTSFARALSNN